MNELVPSHCHPVVETIPMGVSLQGRRSWSSAVRPTATPKSPSDTESSRCHGAPSATEGLLNSAPHLGS